MPEGFETSCHCGAIRLSLPAPPEQVTSCNCSMCFRLGSLWAYYPRQDVRFIEGEGQTVGYIQGDRMLETHHCPTCACVTHWFGLGEPADGKAGVNVRLGDRAVIEALPVKSLNGAGDWESVVEPAKPPRF